MSRLPRGWRSCARGALGLLCFWLDGVELRVFDFYLDPGWLVEHEKEKVEIVKIVIFKTIFSPTSMSKL